MSNKMQAIDIGERAKIMKLKNESSDPNLKNKVEWLYTGDKIDRDAYLLGKPIDKLLIEKEILKPKESDIVVSTIDLANKIREDPLFEIKKQEIEAKKRLLDNPVRIKQLKQQLSSSSRGETIAHSDDDSDEEVNRHKEKKHKKHKKKKHSKRANDLSSDEQEVMEKTKKHHVKRHKNRSSDDSEDNYKKTKRSNRDSKRSSRSRSTSRNREQESNKYPSNYGLIKRSHHDENRDNNNDNRGDARREKSKAQLEIEEYKKKIEKLKQIRTSSSTTSRSASASTSQPQVKSSKLSEEEKQKKLNEMQQNAEWRNEMRHKNISKYRQEEKREDELESNNNCSKNQQQASNLFNNIMRDAYVSAEDRIKRNIKNIQRNESAFDRNFARK